MNFDSYSDEFLRDVRRAIGTRAWIEGGHRVGHAFRGRRPGWVCGQAAGVAYLVTAEGRGRWVRLEPVRRDGREIREGTSWADMAQLLARLESGPHPAPSGAKAIRALLGEEGCLRADLCLERWFANDVAVLSGESGAARMAEILAAKPTQRIRGLQRGVVDPLGWARSLAVPGTPPVAEARLRRLLAKGWIETPDAFAALLALPESWMPAAQEDRDAFARLVGMLPRESRGVGSGSPCGKLANQLGSFDFLSASRGRWQAYADRVSGGDDAAARRAVADTSDMAEAFAREVAVPLLHRAGLCDDRYDVRSDSPATAIAAQALFGTKSLLSILDVSRAWHGRPGGPGPGTGGGEWPVPFDSGHAPGGLSLAAIADSAGLSAEGTAMSHCVGGYADACRAGRSVIVTVRGADGARVSTLELSPVRDDPGSIRFRVAQHRGPRNVAPPREAEAAARWLAERLGTDRLPAAPGYARRAWPSPASGPAYDPMDDGAVSEAVAAWSPFLPRPLRDPAALERALAGLARDLVDRRCPGAPWDLVGPDGFLAQGSLEWAGAEAPYVPEERSVAATWRHLLRRTLPLRVRGPLAETLVLPTRAVPFLAAWPLGAVALHAAWQALDLGWPVPGGLVWLLAFGIAVQPAIYASRGAVSVPLGDGATGRTFRMWAWQRRCARALSAGVGRGARRS